MDIQVLKRLLFVQILPRGLGLFSQGFQLGCQFGQDVIDTQQVLMLIFELLQSDPLALLEFHDSGRLVEQFPPLFGFGGKDAVDLALPDNRIPLLPDARIIEDLIDVTEAHRCFVDQVFALAGPVEPTCHGHFLVVHVQHLVGIVECNRHGSKTLGLPQLGTGKNDVLHVAAPQLFGALFAQNPADRVRNIGFAAPVRTYYSGNTLLEGKCQFIGEGLEALHLYGFQIHIR